MTFKNALKADLLFQWHQGFYLIYIVLTLVYIIIFRQLPEAWLNVIVPLIVYSDPSVLGMFFIGGIMLLEREQGILDLMTITPLRTSEYVLSKLISLALIGLVCSLVLSLGKGLNEFGYLGLVITVILTSFFYTGLGMLISFRAKTVNTYFVKVVPWTLVLILPCLFIRTFQWLAIIPSFATLKLILGAFNNELNIMTMLLWVYMAAVDWWIIRSLVKGLDEKVYLEG